MDSTDRDEKSRFRMLSIRERNPFHGYVTNHYKTEWANPLINFVFSGHNQSAVSKRDSPSKGE